MRATALALLALSLCGCNGASSRPILHIYAASSLDEVVRALADDFERRHPDVDVAIQTAGSHRLRLQIEQGAPADVFMPAHRRDLDALGAAVESPVSMTCNAPVIAVAAGNPLGVRGVADLARVERLVVGAAEVPIGAYTEGVLRAAAGELGAAFRPAVDARVMSRELNVRQIRARLALGEADAAIVYATDVQAAGGAIEAVPIEARWRPVARYDAAVVRSGSRRALARAWLEHARSDAAAEIFRRAGFVDCQGRDD